MSKYIFKKMQSDYDPTKVVVITETIDLQDLLEGFECFLKASGFILDGQSLELVQNEDSKVE